jgi:Phosphoenolpyruvate-protein kinase (PTS system EI component in bacteria)
MKFCETQNRSLQREWAFQEVATRYAETLSKIDDPYLRERALDIQDVTKRVIRNLQGKAPKAFLSLEPAPHSGCA